MPVSGRRERLSAINRWIGRSRDTPWSAQSTDRNLISSYPEGDAAAVVAGVTAGIAVRSA
jgi:hypothetical protein